MAEWFDERYISRIEHQQIVEYYKKVVVQLHRKVKELRAIVDARPPDFALMDGLGPARQAPRVGGMPPGGYGGNVISFEAWRRARRPSTVD